MPDASALSTALLARLHPILAALQNAGGWPLIVGGAVRDQLIGLQSKDIDIEVYHLTPERLPAALAPFGAVNAVGRSFGVLKLRLPDGFELDVALPRRENRSGPRGALAEPDPAMTPQEAAARRDFTWNALAITPDGQLLDFYGGVDDLRTGIIRHVSEAFSEDPLRVLRAMQFAARFDMRLAPETVEVCRALLPQTPSLPRERVWGEWWKWAVQGRVPSAGLHALQQTGWLTLYPSLVGTLGSEQDPGYHPEGDVWTHTCHVCDAAARLAERDGLHGEDRAVLLFSALCHDLGKPETQQRGPNGRIRNPGHAAAGVPHTEAFLRQIGAWQRVIDRVVPLVREHSAHFSMEPTPRAMRRLAARLAPATIVEWGRLIEADFGGRPPLPPRAPAAESVAMARELRIAMQPMPPILRGRDLLDAGMASGPQLGALLRAAYEAQIDGAFATVEEGLAWLHARETAGS
jgi:tRNA nucleotidyltransferase (CCA-adding enzyme)